MFILFTLSFGDDFYIAAAVLMGIEVLSLFLKFFDFRPFYDRFKEHDLVDDKEKQRLAKEGGKLAQ